MEVLKYILSIVAGIASCIPLVIKLIEYVEKVRAEKNWPVVLAEVMKYMAVAEEKFASGVEKKEFVLAMIAEFAKTVEYDINLDAISKAIDDMCQMSKKVNVTVVECENV